MVKHELNVRGKSLSNHLYLVIVSSDGAAWRIFLGGGFWGFRYWSPFTGDGKSCFLVTVQCDNSTGFVNHVIHAIFLQPHSC